MRPSPIPFFAALIFLALLAAAPISRADDLPYFTRTEPYAGWSAVARGDIRTVGMAGATVGLADTFIASGDNPAGLAMTLNQGDLNFAANRVHDADIQNYEKGIDTHNAGASLNIYPWGFSVGYVVPYAEGQIYTIPTHPDNPAALTLETRELRLALARVFLDNRLAIGTQLTIGQAEKQIRFTGDPGLNDSHHSYAVGATFGALYQLPKRYLIGLSYSMPMTYPVPTDFGSNASPGLPGFFQQVEVPARVAAGLGWIPNRFFRADLTFQWIMPTRNAFLLGDQTVGVGQKPAYVPRIGAAYNFIDFKNMQGTVFGGSYYETSRVEGAMSRLHLTGGMEIKPWAFTAGWGIDAAHHYKNYLVSLGIDIFKLLAKADLIPTPPHPAYGGFLPNPTINSDEGLPRPLVKDWHPEGPSLDPIDVGLNIPRRLGQKVKSLPQSLGEGMKSTGRELRLLGRGLLNGFTGSGSDSAPKPGPAPLPKKRPHEEMGP